MIENLSILIFGHFSLGLNFLGEVKQNISSSISFFLIITNSKVVMQELLNQTDLTRIQAFCINELMEVIVFILDEDFIFIAF